MGEKYCAICGTEIKQGARFCHGCGTPIEQVSAPVAQEAAAVAVNAPKKKSKAPLIITLSCIGGLIVAAVVVLILLICMKEDVTLPYGLQPDMTQSESNDCMTENGFVELFNENGEYYYDSTYQFGHKTEFSALYIQTEFRAVVHFYSEIGYDNDNEGPKFLEIKQQLIKKYGEPEYDDGYKWVDGEFEIDISYLDAEGFFVSYIWTEE